MLRITLCDIPWNLNLRHWQIMGSEWEIPVDLIAIANWSLACYLLKGIYRIKLQTERQSCFVILLVFIVVWSLFAERRSILWFYEGLWLRMDFVTRGWKSRVRTASTPRREITPFLFPCLIRTSPNSLSPKSRECTGNWSCSCAVLLFLGCKTRPSSSCIFHVRGKSTRFIEK